MLDIQKIRNDFPILNQEIYGKSLIYLDNGATTQKPNIVIDKINSFYYKFNSNIHRAVHYLSGKSTEEYEKARETVRKYLLMNGQHMTMQQ